MKWDGVTAAQYDAVRKLANWEGQPPKGAIFHVAGFNKKAMRVTDIWESKEDFNQFLQSRIMPAVKQIGIQTQPKVKFLPLHALFVPDANVLSKI
jgi:hypothetical protein